FSGNDVRRWDVTTGRSVKTAWPPEKPPGPKAVAVALYPHRLVTKDQNGVYQLHDLDSGQRIGQPITFAKGGHFHNVKEQKALLIWWDDPDQEKCWFQAWSVETGETLGPKWSASGKNRRNLGKASDGDTGYYAMRVPHAVNRSHLALASGDT